MGKKTNKTDGIYFLGKSSEDVTGSQYLIRFGGKTILLECGLYQSSSNSYLDSYKVNSTKFKYKPSEVDYVFVNHAHIDHCGLLPRLVSQGFNGRIITTHETAVVMKTLLLNSCYIIKEESRILSKRYGRQYDPLYVEEDVLATMNLIYEYDQYGVSYQLDDVVGFQWIENSHCIGAAQLYLSLHDGQRCRKILYTSDIGSLKAKNHYVQNTVILQDFVDVAIMESTYGDGKRDSKKNRKADLDSLKTAIDTVLARGGTVVLPCFSFSRTQELLTSLYEIYGSDDSFNYDVVVDSILSCTVSDLYGEILTGDDAKQWGSVYNWKNVRFIRDKDESRSCVESKTAKIVLSASGFCTNGRVVNYLKKHLRNRDSMIIFTGYAGDNPSYLSYRIKNYRENKTISIDKERIPNRADCISLATFSSHADSNDLTEFGSSLNTNKLVLVHGSKESKGKLAERLKEAISNKNNTYKVVQSTLGMIIHL